jgi:predicted cupin superfamily sugar epimerase
VPTASDIIATLGLAPHPEGGHYRETFRDPGTDGTGRPASTAIYYLLAAGEESAWHRVDAAEVWHWYAGAPLQLMIADPNGPPLPPIALGADIAAVQRPQAVVPAGAWQRARSTGAWSLVGCTVAPGFRFEGFEIDSASLLPRAWA